MPPPFYLISGVVRCGTVCELVLHARVTLKCYERSFLIARIRTFPQAAAAAPKQKKNSPEVFQQRGSNFLHSTFRRKRRCCLSLCVCENLPSDAKVITLRKISPLIAAAGAAGCKRHNANKTARC